MLGILLLDGADMAAGWTVIIYVFAWGAQIIWGAIFFGLIQFAYRYPKITLITLLFAYGTHILALTYLVKSVFNPYTEYELKEEFFQLTFPSWLALVAMVLKHLYILSEKYNYAPKQE